MKNKSKRLNLSLVILASAIILGFVYFATQITIANLNLRAKDEKSEEYDPVLEEINKAFEVSEQELIDECIMSASKNLYEIGLSYCRTNKIKISTNADGSETCIIPTEQANEFTRQLQNEKETCIARYK